MQEASAAQEARASQSLSRDQLLQALNSADTALNTTAALHATQVEDLAATCAEQADQLVQLRAMTETFKSEAATIAQHVSLLEDRLAEKTSFAEDLANQLKTTHQTVHDMQTVRVRINYLNSIKGPSLRRQWGQRL